MDYAMLEDQEDGTTNRRGGGFEEGNFKLIYRKRLNLVQRTLALLMIPAEVKQRTSRGGDPITRPAQQVKLRQGSRFLRLDVLQIEAAHKEVLTPDMLGHQVHLNQTKGQTGK